MLSNAGKLKRPVNVSETLVMRDLPTRCTELRMGEPRRLGLQTIPKASEYLKTASKDRTHLLEVKNHTQRSYRGSATMRMHRKQARMGRETGPMRKRLQKWQKSKLAHPQTSKKET